MGDQKYSSNRSKVPDSDSAAGSATSTNDPAAAVLDDLETLRARAATAEQERDEFLSLLKRTQADFENYQKRNHRDREQERRYWYSPLVLDMLPALDNLERAIAAAKQANDAGPLAQGVSLVQSQLVDQLRRHGITRIDAQGKPFDPNLHQAVMQQPSADFPPNTVIQVFEPGYMIHDRVLRPASVMVSTRAEG